jgi:hypothetical protein
MVVHPWSGPGPSLDGDIAWMPPSGSARTASPDGPGMDRTRWDEAGRQGTARKAIFGWTDGRFALVPDSRPRSRFECRHPVYPRRSVIRVIARRSPVVPSHAGRSPVNGPSRIARTVFYGNRLVGCRAGTGTRSTGVVPTQGCRLRAAGRNTAARRPRGRPRDLAPGSELSRVVRWRGDEPQGRAPVSDRSASTGLRSDRCRELVPVGRFKAMRGAMPIDTRSAQPSVGTRQGPAAMPRT